MSCKSPPALPTSPASTRRSATSSSAAMRSRHTGWSGSASTSDRPRRRGNGERQMIEEADFVVCGGGSAGCVMAARLSEDPEKRVVLLEAGDANKRLLVDIPAGLTSVVSNPETNWMYFTEPDAT